MDIEYIVSILSSYYYDLVVEALIDKNIDHVCDILQKSYLYKDIVDKLKKFDINLVTFDFDCTISSKHTCSSSATIKMFDNWISEEASDDKKILFEFIQSYQEFKEFVLYLVDNGINVSIASYGKRDLIHKFMKLIFGGVSPFDTTNIITPLVGGWEECSNPPNELSKNNLLGILANKYNKSSNQIILLDDDFKNVYRARNAGYHAITVGGCNELFTQKIKSLCDYLNTLE